MTLQEPGDIGYNGFHVSLFYLAIIDSDNVQNPNVTIALKNLAKKNAVTKEKRLSEFLKMLENSSFDVKDYHILVCWLQLYPRLAIDSQKSVRQLAHQILATYMDKYGAKEFSKYLKTAMPIWLQGLFDDKSIANSVRSELLKCFAGDESKVNYKIWIIFHEQIINYCHAVLIHESASSITDERSESSDEVSMKYERAVNSALMMFLQIIRLANTHKYFINDTASVQVNEILTSDQLWDNLGSCASKENLNTSLFRSYLGLISELFTIDEEGALKPFTSNLNDLKSVFKTVSKKFIKNVKLSPTSDMSSTIIYSSVILPLLNSLTLLTSFAKKSPTKIKKSFWQFGGSKSFSRLKDILKLGPCNSDPSYYGYLKNFFAALESADISSGEDFPFLDFSSAKDAKNIIQKILLPHFQKLRGHNALAFKCSGIQCLIYVFELFSRQISDENELRSLAQSLFFTFLDSISIPRIRKDDLVMKDSCITYLAQFFASNVAPGQEDLSEGILDLLGKKEQTQIKKVAISGDYIQICTNYYLVLREVSDEDGNTFLQEIIERLEETYDIAPLSQGLTILLNSLSNSKNNTLVADWAAVNLPGFVSSEFVELPLNFLRKLLEVRFEIDYGQLINDFFLKISAECPSYLAVLFGIIIDLGLFKEDSMNSIPDAYAYLIQISQDKNRSDSENSLILAFVENEEICSNLLQSTVSLERQNKLIASIVNYDQFSKLAILHESSVKALISCALEYINQEYSVKFLERFQENEIVGSVLFEKLMTLGPEHDFSALANLLSRKQDILPLEKIKVEMNKALESIDLVSLSISNPLFQNINLIKRSKCPSLSPFILTIAAFLKELSKVSNTEDTSISILRSICSEYISDYNFLTLPSGDETVTKVRNSLDEIDSVAIVVDEINIAEAFNSTSADDMISSLLGEISGKGLFTARQYYISRILVRAFNPVFESMSLSKFDNLEIVYTKLSNHPLKLATFLCSATKFIGVSSKLDRIRNFVFAEILGVRSSAEICESGLIWLSLASSFINVDSAYDILPSHKLGMLINHLASWLECDIAFDNSFVSVRTLLASFISQFIQLLGEGVPDKTWDLAVDLCLNNLGMAQLNHDATALEYFSVRLFLVLSKYINKNVFDDWRQSRISIEEEILELTVAKQSKNSQSTVCHQPEVLVYELFERSLQKATISKEVLAENEDKLYQMLARSQIVGSQKIACSLLKKFIYQSQQDVILEVQMRKSNLSGDNDTTSDMATLNSILLQTVSNQEFHLEEAFEDKNYHDVFRYLWSWVLIFDHFKESTYSMKADYIGQLKTNDSIGTLLNTIFDILPLTEQGFINQLVIEPIEKNEKAKPSQSIIQNYDISYSSHGNSVREEVHFLLAHLCYQTFHFLGSFASQWFNEIRDVQLKQQIEKFSVRFISPILISEMLGDVEKAKDKLTKNDDTLTIKVNKITNEIKSIYVIDEQTMEMVIKIPEKFPLSNVSVEGPVRLGVKENQWKAWLLASQRVITLTNGSIFDCIELFNKNVNLHFSGFEECAICYSILHQDHSLPSKTCPTCSNKFHAACLYKWFKSSGSSTCPLCRSAFNFNTGRS
ncbi:hypothetical protein JCM33374_g4258 [Metschnikowia sp. JCM 33374]|nr:hypothetical protein JCM33374_g4258 [Metschnikowia sp. JCM 33374]